MPNWSQEFLNKLTRSRPRSLSEADAAADRVVDCAGMRGFVAVVHSGAPTYQPCEEDGTPIADTAAVAISSGDAVAADWPLYVIDGPAAFSVTVAVN